MGIRRNVWLATMTFAGLVISFNARAQETERLGGTAQRALTPGKVTGILTDRLTKAQLKAWESILQIVLAQDAEGRPQYPALYELYQQADASNHVIQIEISTRRSTLCAVGFCRIELHTGGISQEVVLIRLNLGMIDRAAVSELNRRANGLVPFAGLKKKERYAEALGHELAHVVRLLTNPDYRALYHDRQVLADASSEDVQAIGRLNRLIENPAEEAEVEIWRELTGGREPKP